MTICRLRHRVIKAVGASQLIWTCVPLLPGSRNPCLFENCPSQGRNNNCAGSIKRACSLISWAESNCCITKTASEIGSSSRPIIVSALFFFLLYPPRYLTRVGRGGSKRSDQIRSCRSDLTRVGRGGSNRSDQAPCIFIIFLRACEARYRLHRRVQSCFFWQW